MADCQNSNSELPEPLRVLLAEVETAVRRFEDASGYSARAVLNTGIELGHKWYKLEMYLVDPAKGGR